MTYDNPDDDSDDAILHNMSALSLLSGFGPPQHELNHQFFGSRDQIFLPSTETINAATHPRPPKVDSKSDAIQVYEKRLDVVNEHLTTRLGNSVSPSSMSLLIVMYQLPFNSLQELKLHLWIFHLMGPKYSGGKRKSLRWKDLVDCRGTLTSMASGRRRRT